MLIEESAEIFPKFTDFDPMVPVFCVTPNEGRIIHRFFDSSPVSPSGQYIALTRFPFENRSPKPGDSAEVIVIDLTSGHEQVIAKTHGWDSQLGAQVQWGTDDGSLFFNDMDVGSWRPFGVKYNVATGERVNLGGTVYHVSPDGRHIASACLLRANRTQLGYGVLIPSALIPENNGAPSDDGIYLTDAETGDSRLLVSIADLVHDLSHLQQDQYLTGDFYAFHTKWSPDGERLMAVLRWTPKTKRRWLRKQRPADKKSMRKFVVTVSADGSDARMAISDDLWARGGHHPNWHPDSKHVTMNLNLTGDGLRFISASLDGGEVALLHPTAKGSGHPSLHPVGRFLLTDAYPGEPLGFGDGTVPIRLIDLASGEEHAIARIQSRPYYIGDRKEMRLDAHPAWDRTGNFVIFNGCPDGTRRVYIADLRSLLGSVPS